MEIEIPDGPFRWTDAAKAGMTQWQLSELLRDHVVRRVLHSVYVRADQPDSIRLRADSARLVLPEHVVVSDRSAAWLLGVDTYSIEPLEEIPDLEVVSTDGHEATERPGVLGGKRDLLPDEICEVCGIRTTTALRTACDLACQRGRSAALAVLDAFMRAYGLQPEDFQRMLPRFKGRRGVKQLRELVNYAIPDAESPGESWTRMAIIDAGLPAPKAQVWVDLPGFGRVRLDLAWPTLKIAVEYDGEEFHTEQEDREYDEARRTALRQAGWVVIVVTKSGFTGPGLDSWLTELRASYRDRSPRPARRRYSRGEPALALRPSR